MPRPSPPSRRQYISPWADEAAALAAAASTQAASLAAAQQTESDTLADDEEQAETAETDAQTQFQKSQVANQQALEESQATEADNEIDTDAQVLETSAPHQSGVHRRSRGLNTARRSGRTGSTGRRYYPYASVAQNVSLSLYSITPTSGVSFDAPTTFIPG